MGWVQARYYKQLAVQAAREFARAVSLCGAACDSVRAAAAGLAGQLSGYFERERSLITAPCSEAFTACYGMHAATNAVLTGLTTAAEEQLIYDRLLSNPAHVCSFSARARHSDAPGTRTPIRPPALPRPSHPPLPKQRPPPAGASRCSMHVAEPRTRLVPPSADLL